MKFLKRITSASEIVEQNYDVIYYNSETKSVTVKKNVPPVLTITVSDNYTDTSIIGLTATRNMAVQGDITWTTDLASGIAEIENNTLKFLQHYEGTFKLTATATNASDEKSITVLCDEVATGYTYSVSNVSTPTVAWNATSATINFTGITTAHYKLKADDVVSAPQSQVVKFEQNPPQGDNPMDLTNVNTEYVDLGLPSGTKWAKCNLGATTEEGYGAYFSWGDTKGYATATDKGGTSTARDITDKFLWNEVEVNYTVKQNGANGSGFSWATEKWNGGNSSYDATYFASVSGQVMDSNKVLLADNDAAHVHMGGNWRMPTTADTVELYNNTTSTWYASGNTEFNGVAGRKFASKTDSSKYIFIPAAGYCNNSSLNVVGSNGYVWSGSLYSSYPNSACNLGFNSSYVHPQYRDSRYYGFSVRGVSQ